jgi:SAM-dependent methyltransferase
MDTRELHESNRAAWNEAAARYEEEIEADVAFLRGGGANFVAPELEFLEGLGSWCRRAVHLQCAGGRDTLSLWNLGAREVVGVDISERMIGCARRKSEALGAPAQWYRCDVLDAPSELDGTADLVYTGRGALCWIMDLQAWAGVVARVLRTGGKLYLFEGHPIAGILDPQADHIALDPEWGDYFATRTYRNQGWPAEYIGDLAAPPERQAVKYERQWTLGQIVSSVVDAGLVVRRLVEHPEPFWNQFPNMPPGVLRRIPQTFSLLATRT